MGASAATFGGGGGAGTREEFADVSFGFLGAGLALGRGDGWDSGILEVGNQVGDGLACLLDDGLALGLGAGFACGVGIEVVLEIGEDIV